MTDSTPDAVTAYAEGAVKLLSGSSTKFLLYDENELRWALHCSGRLHDEDTFSFRSESSDLPNKRSAISHRLIERISIWSLCDGAEEVIQEWIQSADRTEIRR
jgi:hypothetical protein